MYGLRPLCDITFSDTKQLLVGCREQLRKKYTELVSKELHSVKSMNSKNFVYVLSIKQLFPI